MCTGLFFVTASITTPVPANFEAVTNVRAEHLVNWVVD